MFLWQCFHRSIPTREVLNKRGLNIPPCYPLCNDGVESIIHTLRDCRHARDFWNSFPPLIQSNPFYGANLLMWLRINYTSHLHSSVGITWSTLFTFGVWCLWIRRNSFIFRNQHNKKNLMAKTIAKASEFAFLGVNEGHHCSLTTIQVRWLPPSEHWFKLNSNGSSLGNPGKASGGGLIHNHHREWVCGYSRAIGHTTSVAAKL